MAEVGASPDLSNYPTNQTMADAVAAAIAAIPAPVTSYINGGAPITVATLLATYPAAVAYKGLYARVSDLFNNGGANGVDEIVRCRFDAANAVYRWVPQRDSYNATMTPVSGGVSLVPLVTPPTVRLAGTLAGNLTVTPSAANAYIGQKFDVIQNSTLGLFVTTITGLLGSNITLLGNNTQTVEYTSGGWVKGSP